MPIRPLSTSSRRRWIPIYRHHCQVFFQTTVAAPQSPTASSMNSPAPAATPTTQVKAGNIRIVGRIRGLTDLENELGKSLPWISVSRTDGSDSSVMVSLRDESGSYKELIKLNQCYEQNNGNEELFFKEIKPLVSEAFEGQTSTIIAFGGRRSGKTYTIQANRQEISIFQDAQGTVNLKGLSQANSILIEI